MKITDITTTNLSIGKSLVRVLTDSGIEGWAEGPSFGREFSGVNLTVFDAYLDSLVKPILVGEDPLQIDRHWEALALGRGEQFSRLPGFVVGICLLYTSPSPRD